MMFMPIDTQWFIDKLAQRDMSQRDMAKLMGVDPASVNRMLRGQRKMTMAEAAQFAALLNVSTAEMFERAGLDVPGRAKVKLLGHINAKSEATFGPKGGHSFVDSLGELPLETIALQARTAGTKMDRIDGFIYYIDHQKSAPANYMGSWCLCALKDNGAVVGMVKKGYARGTYNLVLLDGEVIENVEILWSSPLLYLKYPS
jgi:transcriptional regulator with XRE-family HTH domain